MANKEKVQIACPKCGSFKTESFSKKSRVAYLGGVLILAGAVFCIFIITAIIGIPLMFIGICVALFSIIFIKSGDEMRCKNCEYKFNKNSVGKDETR